MQHLAKISRRGGEEAFEGMSVQLRGRFRWGHGSDRTWEMWKQEALARISSKLW
jgi:hypothetical protein